MTAGEDDELAPWGCEDALQEGLEELLAGPRSARRRRSST
jgi:hypothetical protein